MNILENIVVTLTEQDINEMIVKELKSKGYDVQGIVSINLKTVSIGYGRDEHDTTSFKDITCKAKKINE